MAADSGPTDGACVMHRKTDELLVEQRTVSDGKAASSVKQGAKHTQFLSCVISHLVDCADQVRCRPKIPYCSETLYWLSENLDCCGLLDAA